MPEAAPGLSRPGLPEPSRWTEDSSPALKRAMLPDMGSVLPAIDDTLTAWIGEQQMFFVATAPRADDGHVNCSPRGADAFRVLDPHTVMWGDRTGSGIETISHLHENGRIVVMFCAFNGAPRIVRLHGHGSVIYPESADFPALRQRLGEVPGLRAIIRIAVTRISSSCGMGVPTYLFAGRREALDTWATAKDEGALAEYRGRKNTRSVDGLPGYRQTEERPA